jgi:6-phosphogluconolactonase (cycloisomerase 2 family)
MNLRLFYNSLIVLTLAASVVRGQNVTNLAASGGTPTNAALARGGLGFGNNATAEKDHQNMMDQLGIKTIRPGRNGSNTNSPNYANYDEAKANPFPNLPDPLVLKNGKKVTTAEMWQQQRRPEIVEDFDLEIYGRVPTNTPKVNWEVVSTIRTNNGNVPVITKTLVGHVDNSSFTNVAVNIDLTLTTPVNATGPVPVMMQFGFNFPPGFFARFRGTNAPGGFGGNTGPTWQQQVLAKGWGYAVIMPYTVQADNGAGLTQGIIGLVNKGQHRKPDDWGALRAWAWGASRVLDYFETDPAVDAKQVGLEGHSRFGKATLVTMAYDPRFAIAYVSSSGEGGAKLHRRNWGEVVENIAGTGEYHWMAGNFIKYAGPLNWGDLPVDSHELISMCAPRPVFISAGATQGDGWVDAKGSFMAAAAAGPVYTLLGKKDLGTTNFPPIETTLIDGDIAFRQHSGGHTDVPNWPTFLKFASRYLQAPSEFAGKSLVYFGTYTGAKSKGIYVSQFDSVTGKLSAPELAAETRNPTFLAVAPGGNFLYAVNEVDEISGKPGGAVSAFARDASTGKLTLLNQQDSGGVGPCHVAVDATGKCLLVANYGSGSVAALPIQTDGSLGEATTFLQHTGSGANPQRQAGPHAHFILPSPDNRFTLDCDLGLDKIFINHLDANSGKLTAGEPPFATVAPGSGPRHLVFSPDGRFVYVVNEMGGAITVFSYAAANAVMTEVQTISTLPEDFAGKNTAAEIAMHPNGKFLYASNRGHDSIAVFAVNQQTGQLTFVEHQSTLGRAPRHFAIDPTGRWLLAENQTSSSVVVFAIDPDTGRLQPTGQSIAVGSPVCAVFVPVK